MLLIHAKGIREFSQSQQSGENTLPHHCAAIIFWSFDPQILRFAENLPRSG